MSVVGVAGGVLLLVVHFVEVEAGGDGAHVCIDVSEWLCLPVAATSACEVPPAVTVVNTRG